MVSGAVEDLIPYTRLEELEKRLDEGTEPLSHDEAFACLRDVQEIVERDLLPVGTQVDLPGHPGFAVAVVIAGRAFRHLADPRFDPAFDEAA